MNSSSLILQNIRVRGLGDVVESKWVETGKNTTFFCLPDDFNRRGFLQALQTVNPPYDCRVAEPFKHYPLIRRQGKYKKRVRPHRRTISFAIFVAQPQIVKELAAFTPHLFEADRVEVGRRLDYSRWVNFVEIAGSTRWSEMEDEIKALARTHKQTLDSGLWDILDSLSGSDRITDRLLADLAEWLGVLAEEGREGRKTIDDLLFRVNRQNHISKAKQFIRRKLPVFHHINQQQIVSGRKDPSQKRLVAAVREHIDSLVYDGKESSAARPVLLFDEPAFQADREERHELRQYVAEISHTYQCLFVTSEELGGAPPAGAACITARDLLAD